MFCVFVFAFAFSFPNIHQVWTTGLASSILFLPKEFSLFFSRKNKENKEKTCKNLSKNRIKLGRT
jgi:hypothetical protein